MHERYGPWAVVTGASDGIGRAFAGRLAREGFNLVLAARTETALQELAETLQAHYAIETLVVAADLGLTGGLTRLVEASAGLDVGLLVAAAGFGTSGPFVDADLEDELAMVDVNIRAVTYLSHHFGQRFSQRGRGGLVLMSSLLAFQGVPRAANYAATKAYVQSLAEGLQAELAPLGVDVVASAPGPIHTGFAARANMQMALANSPETVADGTLAVLGRRTTVRPGWLSRLLGHSLAMLPRWGRVRVLALVMSGMTAR